MESVLKPPPGMRWNNQNKLVVESEEEEYLPSEDEEEEEQAQSARGHYFVDHEAYFNATQF